jgi:hypothetical protein
MGQSIFINFDSESLTGSRCRAADDLRSRKFSPMVAGDSLVFDLFLTGVDGILNIQDYSVVRMGVGNLNARPESGTYSVGAVSLDYNNSAADLETAIETATGNGCVVVQLSPFVFKVTFDAVGAQTIPSIDESDLTPRSTVDRQTLQTGDATTREIWLWRLYANPIAFTDVFVDVAGNGAQGTLALSTAGIYDLLGDNTSVKTFFEIELTDSAGDIVTVMQTPIVLTGEVIGTGFSGYIPAPTGLSGDIQSFLASADYAVARNRLLDTDSVVWCNQGDNLQAKYDEAFALLPNGNVQSITNRASLIVMGGTYSSIFASSQSAEYFVDIIGIGSVKTDSIEFVGDLYGDIRNIKFTTFSCDRILGLLDNVESLNQAGFNCNEVTSTGKIENSKFVTFEISGDNSGTIKNVYVHQQILGITGDNLGTIQSINCADFVVYGTNEGVIRNIDCRVDFTVSTNNKLITSVNCYQFYMGSNYGTIESLIGRQDFSCLNNYGTIRDCTGNGFLVFCINLGIVDSCENKFDTAYGNNHSFGSGDNSSVKTFFEIELTDSAGDIVTVMQTEIVLTGEVIGTGFSGYIPAPTGLSGDIQSFLASADNEQARDRLGVEDVSAVWGNITGTLSDQTDLQNEFDAKAFIADPTFTGTVTIPTADITTANISTANIAIADFNPNADGGELSWNNTEKTLNLVTGSDNVTIQVGQEVVLYARNTSGVQMIDGQVVKVIGSQGNNPTIALAQADTPANARGVIGVVTQIIPNNSNGFISLIGKVRDLTLDSGTYTVGDLLYLSNTVAGGLTKVRPDIGVAIGRVIATSNGGNNAGVLEVSIDSEVAVHELEQSIPHNTDAVIICNQGDDIQAKHGEAVLLTPNGNPKSATNRATLLVMTGTYGDLIITGSSYTDIVGIGMPTLGSVGSTTAAVTFVNFENFICESLNIVELSNSSVIKNIKCTDLLSVELNYGIIRDCEVSKINLIDNFGTIQNIKVTGIDTFGAPFKISNINWGIIDNVRVTQADQKFFVLINAFSIRDCYGSSILSNCYNYGVVDGCEASSTTGSRSFCGSSAGGNLGTIRNCRSRSAGSFGGQSSTGVTENCVGLAQSFAANSDFIDWGYDNTDMGVAGSFINCTGGNNSFFGVNLDAVTQRTIEASFINCTAGTQSFGWVVTLDAITIWNGYASNCKAGENSFCSAALVGGTGKIEAGAIIENCSAGAKSFATFGNSTNEGYVLRCRSTGIGAQAFSATATGKVRLCLDGNFDEVNLG